MKLLRWTFWNVVYRFRSTYFTDMAQFMEYVDRTLPPWRKFSPNTWHNDDCGLWEVCLSGDSNVWSYETITIEVGRSMETGEINALTILDEQLAAKETVA